MVKSVNTSEIEEDYYKCQDCGNEGFHIKNTNGNCSSCGRRRIDKVDVRVYMCETCKGVSADEDYVKGCCDT